LPRLKHDSIDRSVNRRRSCKDQRQRGQRTKVEEFGMHEDECAGEQRILSPI
jgi:hypothetical protein